MSKLELARKLQEMIRSMEKATQAARARAVVNSHKTDPEAWAELKILLNYQEPPVEDEV